MSPNPVRSPASDGDARLLDQLTAHYRPEPMGAARRAAFDEALRRRRERRHRRRGPALAAGLATAALALWLLPGRLAAPPAPDGPPAAGLAAVPSGGFEAELFDPAALGAWPDDETGAALPDEYLVLASVFLE